MVRNKQVLAFIIPTLNEEKAISSVISNINRIEIKEQHHIYIVDGGSTDKTVEIAKKKGAIVIKSEKGYGRQYKKAFQEVDCDYIITGDADCTYPFDQAYSYFKKFLINRGYDFLTTNRFAGLEEKSMMFTHNIGNKVLTFLTNFLFGLKIKDSQSGMWIFNKKAYLKLNLINDDMAFSEEIKIEAFKNIRLSKEVPISYYQRVGESKLNYGHGIKNTIFLFKKRFSY